MILGIHSNVAGDEKGFTSGHAWISITHSGTTKVYGLWPDAHPIQLGHLGVNMLFKTQYLIILPLVLLLVSCNGENMNIYGKDDISFSDISNASTNEIRIYFTAIAETLFYCPGANSSEEQGSILIEFVRCPIADTCDVSYPAKRDDKGEYIVLESTNKAIFFRSSSSLEQIFPRK